jgi:hypothetical protein
MARRPRRYRAKAAYCDVQRTIDRQFLFKPDRDIRDIIGSSAGRALRLYPVKLYWLDFNINHRQAGRAPLSDSPEHLQNLVSFDRLFNSLVARGINRLLKRDGGIFSTRNRNEEAVDDKSLEQQLLYAVINPVKDGLVDRVAHWQGVSSYGQLATGEVDRYPFVNWTRWHKAGGKRSPKPPEAFIEWVEVKLEPIPSWSHFPAHKRQALFRRWVRELEAEYRNQRESEGRSVMGPCKLAKLDPRDRPRETKKSGPQPLCHASSVEAKQAFLEDWREFLDRYYDASARFRSGQYHVEFPQGSFRPPLITVYTSSAL